MRQQCTPWRLRRLQMMRVVHFVHSFLKALSSLLTVLYSKIATFVGNGQTIGEIIPVSSNLNELIAIQSSLILC